MDPSDDQHDDDLFADLYGDEPVDAAPVAVKKEPTPVTVTTTTQAPAAAPAPPVSVAQTVQPVAAAPIQKAVDPRAPPQQVVQEEPQQQYNEEYSQNDYSGWDASNMGHEQGHNEGQGYDQMGMNGYNDQGAGSPAIKEDGYVFTMNFLLLDVCVLFCMRGGIVMVAPRLKDWAVSFRYC
ncbi:hypothetical protein BZA77DRAFT_88605 [Pyronema omphalodes]|nr:hypothetical protein BZA77DRAFT_88605 [Pyronema omphalodes]